MSTRTQPGASAAAQERYVTMHKTEMLRQAMVFPEVFRRYEALARAVPTAEGIWAAQRELLRGLIAHARATVPAYRELGHPDPGDEDPFDTLRGLPFVTRAELMQWLPHYCSDEIDPVRCRRISSSGTTGIPVKVIVDDDDLLTRYALTLRRQHRYGLDPQRRILRPLRPAFGGWYEYTSPAAGMSRVAEFGPSADRGYLDEVVQRIRYFDPEVIFGRPSRCRELIQLLTERSYRPNVSVVLTLGDNLSPAVRHEISEFFGTAVYDCYGMREVHEIATQCRRGGYHIEADRLLVEVIDDVGRPVDAGKMGEIVVTNLLTRSMPLLRYRTGDAGRLRTDPCACGSPYPMLDRISGREHARIDLPGDGGIEAFRLTWILRSYRLRRFQVVQEPSLAVTVVVEPAPGFDPGDLREILRRCAEELGHAVPVDVRTHEQQAFVPSPSGKALDFVRHTAERS